MIGAINSAQTFFFVQSFSRTLRVMDVRTAKVMDVRTKINCGPRGGTGGSEPGSGVQRFWGPLEASAFDPSFQKFRVSETPSQRPLRAPERLSGPRGRLFRGLGEVCPFSKERGKKVGHSEASKRPRFPGWPRKGFQPSGSYPRATDNKKRVSCDPSDGERLLDPWVSGRKGRECQDIRALSALRDLIKTDWKWLKLTKTD